MFRTVAYALLTALATFASTAELDAQVVTKSATMHNGWFGCIYWTYCYTLDNRAGTGIVGSFEVDFPKGLGDIDSIATPNGWTATQVPAAGGKPAKVVFTAGWASRMPAGGGPLGGFCITTKCHPRVVVGAQNYRVFIPGGEGGLPSGNGLCSLDAGSQSTWFYGDREALPGSCLYLACTDEQAFGNVAAIVFGAPMPEPIPLGDIGDLFIDPLTLTTLGLMNLDPTGFGQLQLPIPPDPNLAGLELMMQSLTVDPRGGLHISNEWPVVVPEPTPGR